MPAWLMITAMVIATVVILITAVTAIACRIFNRNASKQVIRLLQDCPPLANRKICKEDLSGLPQPVQQWLERSQMIGKEPILTVRLKQTGRMRMKEGSPWMPLLAQQYFRTDEPGLVWKAHVRMAPLLHLSGLDNYRQGKGRMKIMLLSLFPVVDAQGPEIDLGTLVRYLAEMPWFPTAALVPYIKWEPVDESSARAVITCRGISASGIFTFDKNGDPVIFTTQRYKQERGRYILRGWGGVYKEYKEFNGIRIPSKSDVIWQETAGDFNWFQCEITEMEYNLFF